MKLNKKNQFYNKIAVVTIAFSLVNVGILGYLAGYTFFVKKGLNVTSTGRLFVIIESIS